MPSFSHLHVHTQFSLLDGAASIKSLVKKASADKMRAMAITDHGNMFGAFEFYSAVTKAGMVPVIGCEFYLVENHEIKAFSQGNKDKRFHQLLLAKNQVGYQNLSKLCSLGYLDGLYGKYPRIDIEMLEKYKEGLIATSCCIGAQVPQAIIHQGEEAAEEIFKKWHSMFGEDYYVELQRHGLHNLDGSGISQEDVNQTLIRFAKKYNVSVIATNDSHYTDKTDANAHDILLCVNTGEFQSTPKKTEEDSGRGFRFGFPNDEFFFKTQAEMEHLFRDIPEALDNTNKLIDSITPPQLQRDVILPNYILPEGYYDQKAYLRHIALEGTKKRYGGSIPLIVQERLEFELNTICNSGFEGYFLIVQDFTSAARDMGVWVGPGRGSAAGSLVAYSLGITNVDPVKYDLLFERFLNPERVSMPDIDIDFDDLGRDRVIEYVANKYGKRHIAQIITYGTMAAKSAIRDVGRVKQYPLPLTDKLAKLVPGTLTLKDIFHREVEDLRKDEKFNLKQEDLDQVRELKAVYAKTDDASKVLHDAEKLEGSVRNTGVHACGIIIAPSEITEFVPVARSKDSPYLQVQYDVNVIEKAGLLKMDFLGLNTLTIMKDTLAIIRESGGPEIDLDNLPLDDEKTFELFRKGETLGIFQFESPGMQKHMRALGPTRIEDLIAMNALYRPGPMKYIPDFIDRKHGKKKVSYDLPECKEYLEETYGITVYQEQVMLLSQSLAGFTKGMADELRKAMGKKLREKIDAMKPQFIAGATAKGHPEDKLNKIWSDWEEFAAYAFNKSHSTCYAIVAYQTAYLKANYRAEFMAALLKSNMGDIKKITFYMEECRRMGLPVLGPDVNESKSAFSVTSKGEIRFGLTAIKGVGEGAVQEILEERSKNGPFLSIFDLAARVNMRSVNKKNLEALARGGAFDYDARFHRAQYFAEQKDKELDNGVELAIKYGSRIQANKLSGQKSLFGGEGAADFTEPEPKMPVVPELNLLEGLKFEEEVIGMYLSKHPLDDHKFEYDNIRTHELSELKEIEASNVNTRFIVMGICTAFREGISAKGKPYGSFTLLDYSGSHEFVMFNENYQKFKNKLGKDYILVIKGSFDYSKSSGKSWASYQDIWFASDINSKELVRSIRIEMKLTQVADGIYDVLEDVLKDHPGTTAINFDIMDLNDSVSVTLSCRISLNFGPEVEHILDEMKLSYSKQIDERWRLN